MFYSQFILAKKGPLGTIWIAAHLERKLRKNQVADTDIGVSVDSILFPDVPIALRLSSHLLLGVVRIYSRKVNYLFHDCSEALLQIKQAFRSTNVDLPPEESTAPYHSITLPETFHLDDFELPDTAFQGDYDHHVSAKEQITLQDNLDKTGFSTSKFGLDERFGDANASHVGLDLDEELFLHKDGSASIRLINEEDGNNFHQGESSNTSENNNNQNNPLPNWSGYNMPTPGYNIPTPGYNILTPDLNEIFFTHENNEDDNMDGQLVPATPFAVDPDPPSPEITECAPPSTPGLIEETGLARVNDASPSINYDDVNNNNKIDVNNNNNGSNGNNGGDNGVMFLRPCSNLKDDKQIEENNCDVGNLKDDNMQIEENDNNVLTLKDNNMQIVNDSGVGILEDNNMQVEQNGSNVITLEDNNMQIEENGSDVVNLNNNNVQMENNSDVVNLKDTMEIENNSDLVNLAGNNMQIEQLAENNNNINISSDVINSNDVNESTPQVLEKSSHLEQTPLNINSKEAPTTNNQFTEPEIMLQAPSININYNSEFGQVTTAEKVILESDGSVDRTTSNLIGQKRRLEEETSLLNFEKGSTERVSSRQRVRKSNSDFISPDDDLLASILGGKRTPGLRVGPSANKTSLKRQKVGPTPKTAKRKVQLDDSMVLHADVIRQQLINSEDIRRVRKKAPCTRAEIWIIEKGPLEDQIFNESLFTGATEELIDLQQQVYEIDISKPLKQLLRENKNKETEIETPKPNEVETLDAQNPKLNEAETLDDQNSKPTEVETLDGENPKPNEVETLGDQNTKPDEVETLDDQNRKGDEVETTLDDQNPIPNEVETLDAQNPNEEENLNVQTPFAFPYDTSFDLNPPNDILSEFNNENCRTDQQFENNNNNNDNDNDNDNNNDNLVDLSKNEENLPEGLINVNEMKDELDNNNNNNIMHKSEIDNLFGEGIENSNFENVNDIQEGFLFNTDGNATSAVGENSGYVDLESMGNDFLPKDPNDFGSVIEGVDTDFLNVDDEIDYHEEANDDDVATGDLQSLDNSGWSSRTRGVARYMKMLFDEETGHGRKSVAIDQLLGGKTRKEASRMFFETLVLTTKDYIHVNQETPFGYVNVRPGLKLMQSEF